MKDDGIKLLIVCIIVAIYILLDNLGSPPISNIYRAVVSIMVMILLVKGVIEARNKILTSVISVNIILGVIFLCVIFFMDSNEYLIWGSFVCFLASISIGIVVISISKARGKF